MADYVLTDYLEQALAMAVYDKLDDGTFAGRIPPCNGVIAFAASLRECEHLLRSTLEGATPFCGTIMPRPAFRQVAEGQKANVGGRGHSVNS